MSPCLEGNIRYFSKNPDHLIVILVVKISAEIVRVKDLLVTRYYRRTEPLKYDLNSLRSILGNKSTIAIIFP